LIATIDQRDRSFPPRAICLPGRINAQLTAPAGVGWSPSSIARRAATLRRALPDRWGRSGAWRSGHDDAPAGGRGASVW